MHRGKLILSSKNKSSHFHIHLTYFSSYTCQHLTNTPPQYFSKEHPLVFTCQQQGLASKTASRTNYQWANSHGEYALVKGQQAMFTLLVGVRNLSTLISFSVALHHDHTHVLLTYRCFFSNVSSAKLTFKASQDKQRASVVASSNMDTTFHALHT